MYFFYLKIFRVYSVPDIVLDYRDVAVRPWSHGVCEGSKSIKKLTHSLMCFKGKYSMMNVSRESIVC